MRLPLSFGRSSLSFGPGLEILGLFGSGLTSICCGLAVKVRIGGGLGGKGGVVRSLAAFDLCVWPEEGGGG